jgi:hypothetical protein
MVFGQVWNNIIFTAIIDGIQQQPLFIFCPSGYIAGVLPDAFPLP